MAIKSLQEYVQLGMLGEFIPPGPNYHFFDEGIDAKYLVPGHFYSFLNMNPRGNDQLPSLDDWTSGLAKSKPYFDNYPIFLALDQYGLGLNVKLLPQTVRRYVIRAYLKIIMPALEKMSDDTGVFLTLEERLRPPFVSPFATVNLDWIKQRIFGSLPEIKFSFLVDKYKREDMRYLKMIDWPDVPKIGEVNYSNDPTVVSRSAISDYIKNV